MADFLILDGGMGRELKRVGAPFRQPEWSALAMIEAPDAVAAVHRSYVAAGAQVITTNSYALVPFHIGAARFAADGQMLADRAGRVAREVAGEAVNATVRVAASLPPVCGSYRPDLYDAQQARATLAPLIAGLAPHADLWLAETLSALEEARTIAALLADDTRPLWLSFTLDDGSADCARQARLRSGEPVGQAVELALECGAGAILFNCSQPEVMEAAVRQAAQAMAQAGRTLPIGVYANAFPPQDPDATANETLLPIREDLDPAGYLTWVEAWLAAGASIVGGCCGIGPEHIGAIAALERS
ncbi:homocysteine S-methyltransferase family protein [Novosphingobium sp.]|uniref:homocysteine S-methyltransferase family protein n=1 Tax=Novosphingobium sp. TaxID=1874826 RepID=UPI0025DFB429|nr:homocysteine S-methyltransferase family protein [Novosphingobium sp.]